MRRDIPEGGELARVAPIQADLKKREKILMRRVQVLNTYFAQAALDLGNKASNSARGPMLINFYAGQSCFLQRITGAYSAFVSISIVHEQAVNKTRFLPSFASS